LLIRHFFNFYVQKYRKVSDCPIKVKNIVEV
jgi:hypothetical protein